MLKPILMTFMSLSMSLFAGDTVKILFVYGSKPIAKGEKKFFGGLHGGHVSLQYRGGFASFTHSGSLHIFPRRKVHSKFIIEKDDHFRADTSISKYVIIDIPVDSSESRSLDSIITQRLKDPEYDYAFFGFRCASSAYEVLSRAGTYIRYSRRKIIFKFFYPKLLRKRLLNEARQKHWKLTFKEGIPTRKWESDD